MTIGLETRGANGAKRASQGFQSWFFKGLRVGKYSE